MSTTEVPTAQHRYVQPGVYHVVLTIDNLPNHPPAVLQHTIVVTQAAPALSAPVLFLLGLALIAVGLFANRKSSEAGTSSNIEG